MRARGFTLIELLVTIAVAGVLAALAAPSIRDFIVHSKMTNISNEFGGNVLRARNEAVNRNVCVTMCMSSSATSSTPQCTTTGTDWQAGWIAFLNLTCDSSATAPATPATDLLLAHQSAGAGYLLQTQSPTKTMMFNPRGSPGTGSAGMFKLLYIDESNPLTQKFGINICMDGLGRTRTLPPTTTACSDYK